MKHLKAIIVIFFMSSLYLIAQNKDTKNADKHFNEFEYIDAIKDYTKLVEKNKADEYVYSQLAEANFNIFNTLEAEKWYAKALETSQDADMMYKYVEMLKANGKYDQSNVWMQKFALLNPKDNRTIAFKTNPNYIPGILKQEKLYELSILGFNSPESDFGGTTKDGILYFSSARNTSRKKHGWNDEPFLDIYQVKLNKENASEPEQVGGVNTKYHEGLVSFSPDGNTMYFSRESFYEGVYIKDKKNKTKASVIHLFTAKKEGNKWGNVVALPFNSDLYSVKNPSMSADGNTLYFSSNMSGTIGGFDIFKVEIKDGVYSDPINLGNKVNTEGHEMFPFISDHNILYFSSTGHLGLGGLDVFFVDKDGSIKNIGMPINSNSDDLAYTINEKTGEGFVSSNRKGGKGNDDIYAIKRLEPCEIVLTTTVIDAETASPIVGATLTIKDNSGRILSTQTTNAKGKINYTIGCNKPLEIYGKFPDYESNSVTFVGSKKGEKSIQLMLAPIHNIIKVDRVVLKPILFGFNQSNITQQGAFELDKLVAVMKKYPDMVIVVKSHTDNRGTKKYNEKLSTRRAKSTVQYVISKGIDVSRISGIGKGESELKLDCGSKCTDEDHKVNRRSEFIIISGGPTQN